MLSYIFFFAVLLILYTVWQTTVVPMENEAAEIEHNREVRSDLVELRNAIVSSVGAGEGNESVEVAISGGYPGRILFLNPAPMAGRLRADADVPEPLAIANATAVDGETGDFWNGSVRNYSTRPVVYRVDYTYFGDAPVTVYENGVLYNRFDRGSGPPRRVVAAGQTLIDGRAIRIPTLVGNYSETRGGDASVDVPIRWVSSSSRSVAITNATGPINVTVPTRLNASDWRRLLDEQFVANGGHVLGVAEVADPSGPYRLVNVTLEGGVTYDLRMAKVGIGTGVSGGGQAYVTDVRGDGSTVDPGENVTLVVEVRDRFNNPVENASLAAAVFGDGRVDPSDSVTDDRGQATFVYRAGSDLGSATVQVRFAGTGPDPAPAEKVNFSVRTAEPVGGSGGGGGSAGSIDWNLSASAAGQPGLSCSGDRCTYNLTLGGGTLNLTGIRSDGAAGVPVEFSVSNRSVGTVNESVSDNRTGSSGNATATLNVTQSGSFYAYVSSLGSGDRINITVVGNASANSPPSASFDYSPPSPNVSQPVRFNASGSSDPDGTIANYTWEFGDGTTTTTTDPVVNHTYARADTFTVNLTVSDGDKSDTTSRDVTVDDPSGNNRPIAEFSFSPSTPSTGENVTFDASNATDSDGTITSYEWEFGDGTTATGEVVNHSYSATGDYTVNLTVTDDDGATDEASAQVAVSANEPPNVSVGVSPTDPVVGENVTVNASGSADPDGSIANYTYDFGDGTVVTTTDPVYNHSYSSPGTYAVNVTVTDDDGASNSTTATVTVDPAPAPLVWNDTGDWDAGTGSGVVHDSFGDHNETVVQVGHGASDAGGSSLVGYYPLDEDRGVTAVDATGTNNGTVVDVTSSGTGYTNGTGVFNTSSYEFTPESSTSGAFVDLEDGSSGALAGGPITMTAWIRPDEGTEEAIVGINTATGDNNLIWRVKDDSLDLYAGASNRVSGTANVSDGSWHHVAVVVRSDGSVELYVDGSLDGTGSTARRVNADDLISIGQEYDPATPENVSNFFDGNIDEVRLYDRSLSGSEVGELADRNGTLTTASKSFSKAVDPAVLALENVSAVVPSGTNATVYVESSPPGTAAFNETSGPVALSTVRTTYAVSGGNLSTDSSTYRLRVALNASDPTRTACLAGAALSAGNSTTVSYGAKGCGETGAGNALPVANATYSPTNPGVGETVTFDGTNSTDPDGAITAYEWEFGDGTTASGDTVAHSYGSAGTYEARLTVTDDGGATNSTNVTVVVGNGSLRWETPGDWNNGTAGGTVHAAFGDRAPGQVDPGYNLTESGLVAYWPLDEGGPVAIDEVGGYDANRTNGTTAPGVLDSEGFAFTGSGGTGRNVSDADGFSALRGLRDFTLSVWVNNDGSRPNDQGIFTGEPPGDGVDDTFSVRYDESGFFGGGSAGIKTAISIEDDSSGDTVQIQYESASGVQSGGWQHVVFVRRDGGPLRLFVNGTEVPPRYLGDGDGNNYTDVPSGPVVAEDTDPGIYIGSGTKGDDWVGELDEVRLYDRTLSDAAIRNLYNATSPASPTRYRGNLTTASKSFSTAVDPDSLNLTGIDSDLPAGTDLTVTVLSDPEGDGTFNESDPVEVTGTGPVEVTGLAERSSTYRLRVALSTSDVESAPCLGGISLVYGSVSPPADATPCSDDPNADPTARFTTSPTEPAPGDQVAFDATGSGDADGSVAYYRWAFGDGNRTTTTVPTVNYTYAAPGNYTANLTVVDDDGEIARHTEPVRVLDAFAVVGETGRTRVDQSGPGDWKTVTFATDHPDPVVIAEPLSFDDSDPAYVRVRNVTATGFEFRIDEFSDQDGAHSTETVVWWVMEEGEYSLADGTRVEVGTNAVGESYEGVSFDQPFGSVPVAFSATQSFNDSDAVVVRQRSVTDTGFEHRLQEAEGDSDAHATETVGYVAIARGTGRTCDDPYEVGRTGNSVTDAFESIAFADRYTQPSLAATAQTGDGGNTAWLRHRDLTPSGVEVKVDEETTNDGERTHTTEQVGYFAVEETDLITGNASACTAPTANATYSPSTPDPGQTVTFDAANSTDADGSIAAYEWYFEDGTTATGATTTRSYETPGTYNVTLVVTDDSGESNSTTVTVTVDRNATVVGETGRTRVNQSGPGDWKRVDFARRHSGAVVVAEPLGYDDSDPAYVRIRNVTATGFEFRIDEFADQDGVHDTETVVWWTMEVGTYNLSDGRAVVVGRENVSGSYETVALGDAFGSAPVAFSQVQTIRDTTPVVTRQRSVTASGFDVKLQESEGQGQTGHATETVGYVAIAATPSRGQTCDDPYEVGTTGNSVTDAFESIGFARSYHDPSLVATMQTEDGGNTAWLRHRDLTPSGVEVKVDEETTGDGERRHTTEEVGYFATEETDLIVGEDATTCEVPTANATYSPSTPDPGETVTFDATNSTAANGSIATYEWDFDGDGLVDATGATVTRTYDTPGTYNATLVVTDDGGESNSTTVTVTVDRNATVVGETGRTRVNQSGPGDWKRVDFARRHSGAVVVAEPLGYNDSDPAYVRVRNVTETGFEFRIDEFSDQDGAHGTETVVWWAMETGTYNLSDGRAVVVGRENVSDSYETIALGDAFGSAPVAFSQSQTFADDTPVVTRQRSVTAAGFEVRLQEAEGRSGGHATETVGYVAIGASPTQGQTCDDPYEVGRTGNSVTHTFESIGFADTYHDPSLVAAMQTTDGSNTAWVRHRNLTPSGVEVKVDEETTGDGERQHTTEEVGYFAVEETDLVVGEDASTCEVPTANATYAPTDPAPGENVTFDATNSTAANGSIATYEWDFDGDAVVDATGSTVENAFEEAGTYEVTLVVTDDGGESNSTTTTVNVSPDGPIGEAGVVRPNTSTTTTTLGETGTLTTSDGAWQSVTFDNRYDRPVVVGTVNTENDAGHAMVFEARNVTATGAELRVCDTNGTVDGCQTHGTETVGYVVIDAADADNVTGIEAGTFEADEGIDSVRPTVGLGESFDASAVVLANTQTTNGTRPVEARITATGTDSFTGGICHLESTNGCDEGHATETVGWVAIDPSADVFEERVAVGSTGNAVANSEWTGQSFPTPFAATPVVVVSTLTDDGGQEVQVDEARRVNTTAAQVRYCEIEEASTPDACDTHTTEDVGWAAFEAGATLTATRTTVEPWTTVEFDRSYDRPVVVGTTNTHDGPAALTFDARNVTADSAEIRVCESEGAAGDGCDRTHPAERIGYLVIDAAATEGLAGVEAGRFTVGDGLATVGYEASHANAPVVLANVQTTNGTQPVETRVTSATTTEFSARICHQDGIDTCAGSHANETVGWVALEPDALPFDQHVEADTTGPVVGNSEWTAQSFDTAFDGPPVVVASTLTENGGQELKIDEARNVTASAVEVRYCELESGDACDTHNDEDVGWTALEPGSLTVGESGEVPDATFTVTCSGSECAFDGSNSSDPNGDALSYEWTFGDGTTATGVSPNHTYAAEGTYFVTLTVDDGNATDVATARVAANDETPPSIESASLPDAPINESDAVPATASTLSVTFDEGMNRSVAPALSLSNLTDGTDYDVTGAAWTGPRTYEWTLGFSDTDVDVTAIANVSGAQDDSGNVMGTETALSFDVDTQTPGTPADVRIREPAINATNEDSITVVVDDPPTVYGDETVVVNLTDDDGDVVQATAPINTTGSSTTISVNASTLSDGNVTPTATLVDDVGNTNGSVTNDTTPKDTVAPSITSASLSATPINYSDATITQTVTVTFDEAMDTAEFPAVKLTDLPASGNVSTTNLTWVDDRTLTAGVDITERNDDDGNGTIYVGGATDAAGNRQATDPNTSQGFRIDTVRPTISDFDATAPGTATVNVSFNASESLSAITVYINDSAGNSTKLNASAFSETATGGNYTYTTSYRTSNNGTYDASLTYAADDLDNPTTDSPSDSVFVVACGPSDLGVIDDFEDNDLDEYVPGKNSKNQFTTTGTRTSKNSSNYSLDSANSGGGSESEKTTRSTCLYDSPRQGDTFSYDIQFDETSGGKAVKGFEVGFGNTTGGDHYSAGIVRTSSSTKGQQYAIELSNGVTTNQSSSFAMNADQWYEVDVEWTASGLSMTFYDPSGSPVATTSVAPNGDEGTYLSYTNLGGSVYVDEVLRVD